MDAVPLFSNLGFTIPAGIAGSVVIFFIVLVKWLSHHQDNDRAEHIQKWETMVGQHKDAIVAQGEWMKNLMATHQSEMDRQFKLHERNTSALESLTHRLSIVIKEIQ